MTDSLSSVVGKRSNVHVFVHISSDKLRTSGNEIFRSSNGVVLARHVPVECIVKIQILSEGPVEGVPIQQLFPNVAVTLTA
jgi:RNA:NAD 2'-phosphotransferase (TPT1/KptA family)